MTKIRLTEKALRKLTDSVELDAGYNNITLRAFERSDKKDVLELCDGEIEELLNVMASRILRLQREVRKMSGKIPRSRRILG
jgi:hypothetical protein